MSVASKLPSIITKKIFRYAYKFDEDLKSFVQGLQLSAVCKQWREDALPLICSCAFISFSPSFRLDLYKLHDDVLVDLFTYSSNVGFIKSFNFSHLPVSFKFSSGNLDAPLVVFLGALSKFLGFGSICWCNIKSIKIDLINIFLPDYKFADAKIMEEFTDKLYKSMPNVGKMDINSSGSDDSVFITTSITNKYVIEHSCTRTSLNNKSPEATLPHSIRHYQLDLYRAQCNDKYISHQYNFSCLSFQYFNGSQDWIDYIVKCSPDQSHDIVEYPYLKELNFRSSSLSDDGMEVDNYNKPIEKRPILSLPALRIIKFTGSSPKSWFNILLNEYCYWPNLKSLELNIGFLWIPDDDLNNPALKLDNLADAIKDKMPHLEKVTIDSGVLPIEDTDFYKNILQSFGNRVVSFTWAFNHILNISVFSHQLTYLHINAECIGIMELVAANAKTLETLWFKNMGNEFDWAQLQTSDGKAIRFPVLKSLSIHHKENADIASSDELMSIFTTDESKPKITVEFSMLSELCIRQCSFLRIWRVMAQHNIRATSALRLQLHGDTQHGFYDSDNYNGMLDSIGHAVVKAMPYVKHLELEDISPYENSVFEILCQSYSRHLEKAEIGCKTALKNLHFSPSLKKCKLIYPPSSFMSGTQKIYVDNLVDLHMVVHQSIFSWSWFAIMGHRDDSAIFNNMDNMFIYLATDKDMPDQTDSISENHAIKDNLDKIPLVCISKAKEIVFTAESHIDKFAPFKLNLSNVYHINLRGPVSVLPLIDSDNNIKVINEQNIRIENAKKKYEDYFYMFTNGWFGSRNCLGRSALVIDNLEFELDADMANWKYINTIEFSGQLKMSTITKMIPRLFNLSKLEVRDLVIDENMRDTLNSSSNMIIMPLSQSIEVLDLEWHGVEVDNELAVKALIYFLLTCTSLKVVTTRGFNCEEDRLVELYGREYPHIAEIKFNIVADGQHNGQRSYIIIR